MIDIVEFKKEIENNSLILNKDQLFIFIGKDISSEFLFDQYLHIYAINNGLNIIVEDELFDNVGFFDSQKSIRILKLKNLNKQIIGFKGWIFCNSVSEDIKNNYKNIIKLPKLEKWQIIDYISSISNIELDQAEQLFNEYSNIYKLNNELQKLSIFNRNSFDELKDQLLVSNNYEIFDLTNAILQRDKIKLQEIYKSNLRVECFAFLALLIKNFKLVIDIQLARNATAESVGISGKQFWAIKKYNCNKYSKDELIYIYNMLTSIDLYIKSGYMNTDIVQDYIVFKILFL